MTTRTHTTGSGSRPWASWGGHLPLAATIAAAGLSVVSLWWVVPTALCAFAAGWRPGRTWSTAVGLTGVVAGAVVGVAVVPSWITWADRRSRVARAWRSWSNGRRRPVSRSGCGPTANPASCRRTWSGHRPVHRHRGAARDLHPIRVAQPTRRQPHHRCRPGGTQRHREQQSTAEAVSRP
ncbi:hypothetical protein ACEYXF_26850 [Streptomyces asiaticus]|uniref:hypothetical protein n=1 Tax=Streptomyces asiaticus TaxID=114695 RepID=UPI0039BE4B2E